MDIPESRDRWQFQSCRTDGYFRVADSEFIYQIYVLICYDDGDCDDVNGGCNDDEDDGDDLYPAAYGKGRQLTSLMSDCK